MDLHNFTRSRKQLMDPYIAALFIDALLKWVIIHSVHRLTRYLLIHIVSNNSANPSIARDIYTLQIYVVMVTDF